MPRDEKPDDIAVGALAMQGGELLGLHRMADQYESRITRLEEKTASMWEMVNEMRKEYRAGYDVATATKSTVDLMHQEMMLNNQRYQAEYAEKHNAARVDITAIELIAKNNTQDIRDLKRTMSTMSKWGMALGLGGLAEAIRLFFSWMGVHIGVK